MVLESGKLAGKRKRSDERNVALDRLVFRPVTFVPAVIEDLPLSVSGRL
jgi:hypothetical protein